MKKFFCILAANFIVLSSSAAYMHSSSGGEMITVKQLLETGKDNQDVTLRGRITKRLRLTHYLFSDGTGTVQIDLGTHRIPTEVITDKTQVEIMGEYDKEYYGPAEIEVKKIKMINVNTYTRALQQELGDYLLGMDGYASWATYQNVS